MPTLGVAQAAASVTARDHPSAEEAVTCNHARRSSRNFSSSPT